MTAKSFKIPGHWWGKIIGGVIGLFRGGLTGAVIGALLGHVVDRFLAGIMGVGATRRLSAVRWGIARQIVWAWFLTIPSSALVAGLCYLLLRGFDA